jgi:hypothetical protein
MVVERLPANLNRLIRFDIFNNFFELYRNGLELGYFLIQGHESIPQNFVVF